jgi:transmembrane sensor
MNQFEFQETLGKYLSGQHTPEEEARIMDYLEAYPMDDMPVFENEKEIIGKRIRKQLSRRMFGQPLLIRLRPWLSLAACLALIAGTLVWYRISQSVENLPIAGAAASSELVEIKNPSSVPQHIPLRDGSVVILKKNSSLSLDAHFGESERKVYLRGEAFFQIKRNTAKPFIVSTENLETKVLGTSFNVKSYENSPHVEVQVKTGRVSVYEGNDRQSINRNGVILTPNQRIVFNKKTRKMDLSIIENPLLIVSPDQVDHGFLFSEVPVIDVFSALEKSYGINIVLENETKDSCLFTGDLNGLTLFQQLDLICKSTNISYERRGTALFVQGAGCNN